MVPRSDAQAVEVLAFDEPRADVVRSRTVRANVQTTIRGGDHRVICSWGDGTAAAELPVPAGTSRHRLEHTYPTDGVYWLAICLRDTNGRGLGRLDSYVVVHSSSAAMLTLTGTIGIQRYAPQVANRRGAAHVGLRLPFQGDPGLPGELAVLIGETELRSAIIDWYYRSTDALHFGGLAMVEAVWPCRFRGRATFGSPSRILLHLYLGWEQGPAPRAPDFVLDGTGRDGGEPREPA